ncbi:MAG: hypothetical protein ABSH56_29010 [Bryobacteraceae bacterium]|jgi:xanthine/uracil/vitamin C permease (AzgA family)
MATLTRLERYFEFDWLGTYWQIEILAGIIAFMTMAEVLVRMSGKSLKFEI